MNVRIDNNDYTEVPNADTWIHHAWSGDMAAAAYYMPKGVPVDVVGYWFPPDGKGPVANDTITVLRSSPNPVLAHLFLDYMLDLDNVLENISFNGYMQPLTGVTPQRLVKEKILPKSLLSTVVLPSFFRRGRGRAAAPGGRGRDLAAGVARGEQRDLRREGSWQLRRRRKRLPRRRKRRSGRARTSST